LLFGLLLPGDLVHGKSWNAYYLRSADVPKPPWPRRAPPRTERPWRGLAKPKAWPPEPRGPETVDKPRLARALIQICGRLPQDRADRLAGWVHEYAQLFEVDPFMVGALIYRQSRCRSKLVGRKKGIGLSQIVMEPHRRLIRTGTYHYHLLVKGAWQERELDLSRFEFNRRSLFGVEANVYFTAALLSVYKRQCPSLDAAVRGVRHRNHVSHFQWGDRVLGTRFEDEVLQARRRLLWYYADLVPKPAVVYRGVPIYSPLDGLPRVISSPWGDPRSGGRRRHRGVDFYSTWGEPVRAVADGEVIFAGVSYRGGGASTVHPKRSRYLSRKHMGVGGLFVVMTHGAELGSGYFHLSSFTVAAGARVKGGQIIGYVGRSGIKESPSHLHFEMRRNKVRINPEPRLRPYLVPRWGARTLSRSSRKKRRVIARSR
jgi:murein DD-endopeptidase MepM/ murein hydrolase activator NlpD